MTAWELQHFLEFGKSNYRDFRTPSRIKNGKSLRNAYFIHGKILYGRIPICVSMHYKYTKYVHVCCQQTIAKGWVSRLLYYEEQ